MVNVTEECCDECGQSLARWLVLVSEDHGPLQFCAHHFNSHEVRFRELEYVCEEIDASQKN